MLLLKIGGLGLRERYETLQYVHQKTYFRFPEKFSNRFRVKLIKARTVKVSAMLREQLIIYAQ